MRYKGRVIAHEEEVYLRDCRFHVGASGRDRVRREKRKNVHAWVSGELVTPLEFNTFTRHPAFLASKDFVKRIVSYDPYRDDEFMCGDYPVRTAQLMMLSAEWGAFAYDRKES